MKYTHPLAILVVLWAAAASAQVSQSVDGGAACWREKSARTVAPGRLAVSSTRPYDVIRTNVFLDWRRPLNLMSNTFAGSNTLTIVVRGATDTVRAVTLDAADMHIDQVRANSVFVAFTQPAGETITVHLDRPHVNGDTVVLAIDYTHADRSGQGFFLYDSLSPAARLAYTMSEPRDAHFWMPCNDDPSDKALSEMHVLVPPGFQVSSNGLLQYALTDTAGVTYFWKEDEPIAPYLMCASASKWAMWSDYYVRLTNRVDTVPIQYFTWHADSTAADSLSGSYNAVYSFRNLPVIMKGYSERFGEYPFTKYGMTAVQPFGYGGMEHQTMTTINRNWLGGTAEAAIAHELTHQWFGDNVTCGTWKDIWLNEGFATYGEAIYSEIMGGPSGYSYGIGVQMHDYLGAKDGRRQAIYDPEGQGLNVFNWATVYRKGGVVLHMLRRILGDEQFFQMLQAYGQHFHFGNATTQDFADFISQYSGQDLHWFVDEWVFGVGHPHYDVTSWVTQDSLAQWTTHVRIVQPDSLPLFRMPVLLRLYPHGRGPSQIDTVVVDSLRSETFDFAIGRQTDSVAFDPDNSILKDPPVMQFVTDVPKSGMPLRPQLTLAVSPNPASDNAIIHWSAPTGVDCALDIVDMLGRTVATCALRGAPEDRLNWSAREFPEGAYIVRLRSAAQSTTAVMHVVH